MPITRLLRSEAFVDCFVLFSVVVLNAMPYLFRLGFLSDDWGYISFLHGLKDHSIWNSFKSLYDSDAWTRNRPLQFVYYAFVYKLFGLDTTGPQILSSVVAAIGYLVLYRVMRMLRLPRILALGATLIYLVLPHYSTDRLWYVTGYVTLSTTVAFVAIWSDLKALAAGAIVRGLAWKIAAVAAIVVSGLLYETALPLLMVSGVFIALRAYQISGSRTSSLVRAGLLSGGLNVVVVLGLMAYKAATSVRSQYPEGAVAFVKATLKLTGGAVLNGYSRNLAELPYAVWLSLSDYRSDVGVIAACLAAVVTFLAISRIENDSQAVNLRALALPFAAGIFISVFSYAIFIALPFPFVKAGVQNRVAIVAAVGVALATMAAITGVSAGFSGRRSRSWPTAAIMAVIVFSCVVVNSSVGSFFTGAYDRQNAIVAQLKPHLQGIAPGSAVLLDGACPWYGPAPVIETSWDATGRLRVLTGEATIRGDVIWPDVRVASDGVSIRKGFGEDETRLYDYRSLYVFRVDNGAWLRLENEAAARSYFESTSPNLRTPPCQGLMGEGTKIFKNLY